MLHDRRSGALRGRALATGALALLASALVATPASAAPADERTFTRRCDPPSSPHERTTCRQAFWHRGSAELVSVLAESQNPFGVEPRWLDSHVLGPDGRVVCRSSWGPLGPVLLSCRITAPGRYTAVTVDRLQGLWVDLRVVVERA